MITGGALENLTVEGLQVELCRLGCRTDGLKAQLIARLANELERKATTSTAFLIT